MSDEDGVSGEEQGGEEHQQVALVEVEVEQECGLPAGDEDDDASGGQGGSGGAARAGAFAEQGGQGHDEDRDEG